MRAPWNRYSPAGPEIAPGARVEARRQERSGSSRVFLAGFGRVAEVDGLEAVVRLDTDGSTVRVPLQGSPHFGEHFGAFAEPVASSGAPR